MANASPEGLPTRELKDPRNSRGLLALTILLPLVLVFARETIAGDTVLLYPAPVSVTVISYAVGLLVGGVLLRYIWAVRRVRGMSVARGIFVSIFIVSLALATFAYLGRWAFELTAFSGIQTTSQQAILKITGIRGGKSGTFVELRSSMNGREIDAKATPELWAGLAAIRPPLWSLDFQEQPYCVQLTTEKGRWGIERARVPRRWENGLNAYKNCEGSFAR